MTNPCFVTVADNQLMKAPMPHDLYAGSPEILAIFVSSAKTARMSRIIYIYIYIYITILTKTNYRPHISA